MVRQKTRYLLIRLEFSGSVLGGTSSYIQDDCNEEFPTRKEVAWATQDSIKNCFGTAASDAASEIQVRFCDATTGLILIRVSRDNYALVRASITMMSSIPAPSTSSARDSRVQRHLPIVASIVSIHGSIRAAKKATMARIRSDYRLRWQSLQRQNSEILSGKVMDRDCRNMEDLLLTVQGLE